MVLFDTYDWELNKICNLIRECGYKRVGVQVPEGLKVCAREIMNFLHSKTNASIVLSGKTIYGACDVEMAGVDFVVHFGHAELYSPSTPTYFAECRSKLNVKDVIREAAGNLEGMVGICTTVQWVHKIKEVKRILGGKTVVGKGKGRVKYPGQVLGCDFSSARAIAKEADSYLYLGSGNFHALGIALGTGKKVIVADPEMQEVREVERLKEKILRQRYAVIGNAKDARSFGIILGEKIGQKRKKLAMKIYRLLERKGKKAYLILLGEITPEHLSGIEVDAFVCTACPRLPIEEQKRYTKPILTPPEVELMLGERKSYRFDEIGKNEKKRA